MIPQEVLDGVEAVRRSGLTNMLDRPVVAELAESSASRRRRTGPEASGRSTPRGSSGASGRKADGLAAGPRPPRRRQPAPAYLASLSPGSPVGRWIHALETNR